MKLASSLFLCSLFAISLASANPAVIDETPPSPEGPLGLESIAPIYVPPSAKPVPFTKPAKTAEASKAKTPELATADKPAEASPKDAPEHL